MWKLWCEQVRKSWKTGTKTEAKTESQNATTTPWSLWRNRWVRKRVAAASETKKCMAVLRNDHILTFGAVFETLLTSLNSFNVLFTILTLLTLCCTWPTIPKHVPHLLIVMYMSIQRLLKCTHKAYTIWICTTSMIVDCVHWVVTLTFSSLWKFNTLSTSCSVCKRNIASLTFLIFQSDQGAYSTCSEIVNLAATYTTFLVNNRYFWHVSQKVFNTLMHASNDVHIKETHHTYWKAYWTLQTQFLKRKCPVHF